MPGQIMNGVPWYQLNSGRWVPQIAGGSGEGEAADGDGGGAGGGEGSGDLGDAGKKAIQAERDAAKAAEKARKAAEKKAADLEARLAEIDEQNKSDSDKALEAARKEASAEAAKAERERWASRIVRSEVKALASGTFGEGEEALRFANPDAALKFLDLDEFEVDDDGEVDSKKVQAALADLLQRETYLAVSSKQQVPSASQAGIGVKGSAPEVAPGVDRLRHAYAKSK